MKLGDEITALRATYVCCPSTQFLLGLANKKCVGCDLAFGDIIIGCCLCLSPSFIKGDKGNCPPGCYFKRKE